MARREAGMSFVFSTLQRYIPTLNVSHVPKILDLNR